MLFPLQTRQRWNDLRIFQGSTSWIPSLHIDPGHACDVFIRASETNKTLDEMEDQLMCTNGITLRSFGFKKRAGTDEAVLMSCFIKSLKSTVAF